MCKLRMGEAQGPWGLINTIKGFYVSCVIKAKCTCPNPASLLVSKPLCISQEMKSAFVPFLYHCFIERRVG